MEKSPHIVCLFSPAALLVRSLNEEYFIKRNLTTLERRLARQPKRQLIPKITAWEENSKGHDTSQKGRASLTQTDKS